MLPSRTGGSFRIFFDLERAIGRLRVGNQSSRQINADHDGHKKIDQQQREQHTAHFQRLSA